MTKITTAVQKPSNGSSSKMESLTVIPPKELSAVPVTGVSEKNPKPEQKNEMTLQQRILKVENLQLIVEKRSKLVATRAEIERFQTSSNDFNCTLRLNDSDGNVFTTNFTPGIKKVIEFLKGAFDASIGEAENKIVF